MKISQENKKIDTLSLLKEVTSRTPDLNKIKQYTKRLNIQFDEDLNQQMANIMFKMSQVKKGTPHEPSL